MGFLSIVGLFSLITFVPVVGVYMFVAYVLYRIGKKFGPCSYIEYLVPIYNMVLTCKVAGLHWAYVFLLFAPGTVIGIGACMGMAILGPGAAILTGFTSGGAYLVALGASIYMWSRIAARMGKDPIVWGVFTGIFWLPAIYLAFCDTDYTAGATYQKREWI